VVSTEAGDTQRAAMAADATNRFDRLPKIHIKTGNVAGKELKIMTSERSRLRRHHGIANRLVSIAAVTTLGLFSSLAIRQSPAQSAASSEQKAVSPKSSAPQSGQQKFSSAVEATQALVTAVQKDDQTALLKILGANAEDIVSSGDAAEDKNDRDQFAQKYQQMHRLVTEPDGTTTLYIGAENWPTPIPLVHKGSEWYFDTAAGKQEILYRRVGKNEMSAIQVCRELVDAEKEYYGQPHDGDQASQYAQKLFSDPGKHNGLYWEASSGGSASPIGPLLAQAEAASHDHQPFQGYYFQLLKGERVGQGERSYVVDGKMTRGFAFIAYPAEYRSSGVMTFLVNQDGVVYEKDLGPRTAQIAKTLTRYNRDATWRKTD